MRSPKPKFTHPGILLKKEFLEPLGISAYRLGRETSMPQGRISLILRGERSITLDTAMRLSAYFGNSIDFWLHLQVHYDLAQAKTAYERIKKSIIPFNRGANQQTTV